MVIKVNRINKLESNTNVKAFVDLIFDGCMIVKGFKVVNGDKGLFVGYPSEKSKKGDYINTVVVLDEETRSIINKTILNTYNETE